MKTWTGLLLGVLFTMSALAGDYSYHDSRRSYRDGYRDGCKDGTHDRHTRRERSSSGATRSYSPPFRVQPAGIDLNNIYSGSRFAPMNSSRPIKSDR
ncbi:MAG TPA: hypothetical protein P5149_10090 [Candidatus Competibacteraceae bacterium]|mgnify:CR=1 FL=1|nr:hypothetical protein [Candidatus Competibacteraceae bacterium]MCP5133119.1 hypothetical protein [Gammaproteobacteria bacterium]HPF59869.1 hypothetical protein [Candidatus Competibacteraceae bacterium]HRY18741.1 hypothetical protein [Candidatus Competibacteraceae bacterium]